MSSFLPAGGGGRTNAPQAPATQLRIQSSANGIPIPIVHGRQRIAGNLIDYFGFLAFKNGSGSGGKGGDSASPMGRLGRRLAAGVSRVGMLVGKGGVFAGGGKGTAGGSYSYDVIAFFGLCEGPIASVPMLWNGKTPTSPSKLNIEILTGLQAQPIWTGFGAGSPYAAHELQYSSLAYIAGGLALGNSPDLPNLGWEVLSAISGAVTETYTISGGGTFTPTYFSLADSATEDCIVPPTPYKIITQNPSAQNTAIVLTGSLPASAIFGSNASGVVYTETGSPLTRVGSSPTTGQYTQTGNALYTFASGDEGAEVTLIDLAVSPGVNFCYQPTGNTHGTTTIDSISSMTGITVGHRVLGSGVAAGTVVTALGASSITVNNATTSSLTGTTLTFIGAALTQVLNNPGHAQFTVSVQGGSYGQYGFSSADSGSIVIITDIPDTDPSLSLIDFLTNPRYGCGFPAANVGSLTALQNYAYALGLFISPALVGSQAANAYLKDFASGLNGEFVWSGGLLTFVPYGDATVSGNGYTFTPSLTPIYSLSDDDYLPNEGTTSAGVSAFTSDDPVVGSRKRQSDAYNRIQIEYLDRGNSYNPAIVYEDDDASVNLYGLRPADTKSLHFFAYEAVARQSASLQLGRQQVRNLYTFTVPWRFILLDPMDIIAITDTALGLSSQLVRILEITENQQDWSLTITSEEVLVGTANAPLYGKSVKAGFAPPYNEAPGNPVPPIIFEPPPSLTANGGLAIWVLSGGIPPYGGVQVWTSTDNETYDQVGEIVGSNRIGITTADFPLGIDPDTVNTLSVDLSGMEGSLTSGTDADADAGNTLCYIAGNPAPQSPTLSAVTSGALSAQNLYVVITWIFVSEGPPSAEVSLSLSGGQLLSVASPAAQSGATGWNVYVGSAAGGETLQNGSPIAIGTAWTESGGGITTTGATPPDAEAGYELASYSTATLTSQYEYSFSGYLRRGQYDSTISDHPAGSLFARLDGTQLEIPYSKDRVGTVLYVKLVPFNIYGGGGLSTADVEPWIHIIQGPPPLAGSPVTPPSGSAPGVVQNFSVNQQGFTIVATWTDLTAASIKGYDLSYGPVGGGVANSTLITEAARTTASVVTSVPPGAWTFYLRARDIANQVGSVSIYNLTVINPNNLLYTQANEPSWPGPTLPSISFDGCADPDSGVSFGSFSRSGTAGTAGYISAGNSFKTAPATSWLRRTSSFASSQPVGRIVEGARTNAIRNNSMAGAAAGTPGTAPTDWTLWGSVSGLTQTVVNVGVDYGMFFIDVKLAGTANSASEIDLLFETTSGIAASHGQNWSLVFYIALVGGSLANVSRLRPKLKEYNSSHSFLQDDDGAAITPTAVPPQQVQLTAALGAATAAFVVPALGLTPVNSGAVNVTLRIYMPQAENNSFNSSIIPTSGATKSRAQDVWSFGYSGFFGNGSLNHSKWTLVIGATTAPGVDTTEGDQYLFVAIENFVGGQSFITIRRTASNRHLILALMQPSSHGNTNDIIDFGVIADNTYFVIAVAYDQIATVPYCASLNGNVLPTPSGLPFAVGELGQVNLGTARAVSLPWFGTFGKIDFYPWAMNQLQCQQACANGAPARGFGFHRSFFGALIPEQTYRAQDLTNAELFEDFLPYPVATATYLTPYIDTLADAPIRVSFTTSAMVGRGGGGTRAATSAYFLDAWSGVSTDDPEVFIPWSVGNVTAEFLRGMAQLSNLSNAPAYLAEFDMAADAPAEPYIYNGFAVGGSGTAVTWSSLLGVIFHAAPNVQVTPTDGTLTSGDAISITATGATIQGYVGSVLTAGTVNLIVTGY